MGKRKEIGNFEVSDPVISNSDPEIMNKEERIELYERYLPHRPTQGNTLSRVCSQIIQNKLIGTEKFHNWLKRQNRTNSQIVIRELFHIFSWRLIKNHRAKDIYHFIRISNKLIEHATKLNFTELSKYIEKWRDKILKDNLREIIRIRRQFIEKSKNQKSEITDTSEKPKDKNQIINQIINLLSQLKD